MKYIQLTLKISDDMALKSITYDYNTTDLPSNAKTLELIGNAILKSINLNQDKLVVDDLLNELDISNHVE